MISSDNPESSRNLVSPILLQCTPDRLYNLHLSAAYEEIVDSIEVLAVEKADLDFAPALL